MAFRIGRRYAQHTYPQSGGAQQALPAFARNFAQGPAADFPLTTDTATPIVFSFIESEGGSSNSIPITPRVTGVVLVVGTAECINTSDGDLEQLTLLLGLSNVTPLSNPVASNFVEDGGGLASVTIQARLLLAVGVTAHITLFALADAPSDLTLRALNSTLSIQEVGLATG
jgi:hypothetical protein